jgi:hypothetical protein
MRTTVQRIREKEKLLENVEKIDHVVYHNLKKQIMDEVNRIIQLFRDRTSKELSVSSSLIPYQQEELANQLFNVFQSIWTSTSYNQEDETTLDYNTSDDETDECDEEPDEPSDDPTYEEKDEEKPVLDSFSLSYMKRALAYYDAINPKTGQRSHTWKSVQNKFKRITHQSYMARFRDYVEQGGTKKQKIDLVDDYVYNNFERARDHLYPVHDIDLKRWATRKARTISLHGFVASDHWISNFKFKHDICSRKIIKVRTCFVAILRMHKIVY